MFDSTKAVGNKVISDIRRTVVVVSLIVQVILIGYYVYSLIGQNGVFAIKVTLLAITSVYFVFYLVVTIMGDRAKRVKKVGKRIYSYMKYVIHAITLGMSIYALVIDGGKSTLDILFVAVNAATFLLQILLEIVRKTIEGYITLLQTAIRTDMEPFVKLLDAVHNPVAATVDLINRPLNAIVRRITGEERPIVKEEEKVNRITEEYNDEIRESQKQAQKQAAKTERKETLNRSKNALKGNFNIIKNAVKEKLRKSDRED